MAGGKYTQKQKILLVVAIVIFVFSIVNLIVGLSGGSGEDVTDSVPVNRVYYFDMDGKKLIAGDPEKTPDRAARAFVFACGDCSNSEIGYVMAERQVPGRQSMIFVTTPDQLDKWIPEQSSEGQALIRTKRGKKCPDGVELKQCYP